MLKDSHQDAGLEHCWGVSCWGAASARDTMVKALGAPGAPPGLQTLPCGLGGVQVGQEAKGETSVVQHLHETWCRAGLGHPQEASQGYPHVDPVHRQPGFWWCCSCHCCSHSDVLRGVKSNASRRQSQEGLTLCCLVKP